MIKSWKSKIALSALLAGCSSAVAIDIDHVSVQRLGSSGPLVVLLGGSEGGFLNAVPLNNALLADGFRIAEVAYFRFHGGPRQLSEIDIDEVVTAIRNEAAGVSCVGVFGVSKGAELALILAAYSDVADATVAMVPSHVVWQSSKVSIFGASSWIRSGEPMAYVPYETISSAAVSAALNPNNALAMHVDALTNTANVSRATIAVERIKSPILLQAAARDQVWPSVAMSEAIIDRADRLAPSNEITLTTYDYDHYLLRSDVARSDIVSFFNTHLDDC